MGKLARDSRAVRQEPLVHVDPVAQMRVLAERAPRAPSSASASTNGNVTLLRAKVVVRATAPGL